MKTVELTRHYRLAPTDLRARLLAESAWRDSRTVVRTETVGAGATHLMARSPLDLSQLPEAVHRFLPAGAELVVDLTAPAAAEAPLALRAEVPGAPAEITAELELAAATVDGGPGSTVTAQVRIVSEVPFLGGIVEAALEPRVADIIGDRLDAVAEETARA
ncbi:DUF2505 family protein [Brevibacterium litoralis]|uniref:DUF2505 family protein n=1 Tax=Brevibacterium litoralis TaxID=3138935 RepID=UPI0032F02A87